MGEAPWFADAAAILRAQLGLALPSEPMPFDPLNDPPAAAAMTAAERGVTTDLKRTRETLLVMTNVAAWAMRQLAPHLDTSPLELMDAVERRLTGQPPEA